MLYMTWSGQTKLAITHDSITIYGDYQFETRNELRPTRFSKNISDAPSSNNPQHNMYFLLFVSLDFLLGPLLLIINTSNSFWKPSCQRKSAWPWQLEQ